MTVESASWSTATARTQSASATATSRRTSTPSRSTSSRASATTIPPPVVMSPRRVRADSLDGVAADDENDASRALPITTRFYFHVTRASPKLNAAVEE